MKRNEDRTIRTKLNVTRSARAAGILFFVSTAAYLIGDGLLGTALHQTGWNVGLQENQARMLAGVFLELLNAAAVAGIAVFLYPILRTHNEALAAGYFGFRLLESALLLISAAMPVLLLGMNGGGAGSGVSSAGSIDGTVGAELAGVLTQGYAVFFQLGMVVLGIGSFLLCFILYGHRLVPRLLAGFGFIGYAALLTSSSLSLAGQEASPLLFAPGAVFEIVFPLWLIFRGLNVPQKAAQNADSEQKSQTA